MFNLKKILILMLVTNTVFIYADSIEEIVVTGSLIKDQSDTICLLYTSDAADE